MWVGKEDIFVIELDGVRRFPRTDLSSIIRGHVVGWKFDGSELAYLCSGMSSTYFFDIFEDVPKMAGVRLSARMMRREAERELILTGFSTVSGEENINRFLEDTIFPVTVIDTT